MADAFRENFDAGLELGAACALVLDGRVVVDLWAGRTAIGGTEWAPDTLVDCRSATKALTALCLHLLVERGSVELDAPVRRYWPELRCDPTVRQALSHQAGIPVVDRAGPGAVPDWQRMADAVAVQEPMWEPGDRHGYHGVSFGWLVGEPVRRLTGRPLPDVFATEIAGPLGLDSRMGTADTDPVRIATLVAGEVVTSADEHAGLGFAYLNNAAWGGPPGGDPRAARIIGALYRSLRPRRRMGAPQAARRPGQDTPGRSDPARGTGRAAPLRSCGRRPWPPRPPPPPL
ncbi:MAG TPA: serine hydrolase domain-containing protein [Acidimicrobiales bacterium]|nr:serine hydrolase domain-containing protein [Acidimicrobiales bacterium]